VRVGAVLGRLSVIAAIMRSHVFGRRRLSGSFDSWVYEGLMP
jgi:hypothetical protein